MSLYRITTDKFEPVPRTTFAAESLLERKDIQRLLKQDVGMLGEDLLLIAEEFGNWEDSKRRIDLLCLGKDGALVVVEIKRDEDGGHIELQAVRYAGMVSSMSMKQVIQAYAREHGCDEEEARTEVLRFLGVDPEEAAALSGVVRIILVSADFSTEVTAAVLWLNKQGLSIRCIRLRPYRSDGSVFVDATQIIPLPEAADLEPKWREQEREKQRSARVSNPLHESFWRSLIERAATRTELLAGHKGSRSSSLYVPTEVSGVRFCLRLVEGQAARVLLLLDIKADREKRLRWVDDLMSRHPELESAFGGQLEWIFQTSKNERRFRHCISKTGQPPESEWLEWQDEMLDAVIRLQWVLRPFIETLKD